MGIIGQTVGAVKPTTPLACFVRSIWNSPETLKTDSFLAFPPNVSGLTTVQEAGAPVTYPSARGSPREIACKRADLFRLRAESPRLNQPNTSGSSAVEQLGSTPPTARECQVSEGLLRNENSRTERSRGRHRPDRGGRGPERPNDAAYRKDELRSLLRDFERPLRESDYAGLAKLIGSVATTLDAPALRSFDKLDPELRGKLFTALLRASRLTVPSPDEAKESARKSVFASLAKVWKVTGDEQRAASALSTSGQSEKAEAVLKKSGDWQDIAALRERDGKHAEAARLYEEKGAHLDAARCYLAAGDLRGQLRCLHKAKDPEALGAAAHSSPVDVAVPILLKYDERQLAAALLTSAGKLEELATLQERWRRFRDAGSTWEKLGKTTRAMDCYARGKDRRNTERLVDSEVARLTSEGQAGAAAQLLAKHGRHERAADLISSSNPEMAHDLLVKGKLDQKALALAKHLARSARERKDWASEAKWLERSGELPQAAEAYWAAGQLDSALKIFEQLGNWAEAAKACEALSRFDKAADLYARAGDAEATARARARQVKPLVRARKLPAPGS
jgi:tetratricopeptide (TPR) repeat protein